MTEVDVRKKMAHRVLTCRLSSSEVDVIVKNTYGSVRGVVDMALVNGAGL